MQQDSEFTGDRHGGFLGSDACRERSSPALQRAGPRRSAEQNFGRLEQKATDHSVSALGYPTGSIDLA
jgi:hypothetical protein